MSDWNRFLVYIAAALMCGYSEYSKKASESMNHQKGQILTVLGSLYLLAGANSLVRADLIWVNWVRTFAHEHNAYQNRHAIQLTTLLMAVLLAGGLFKLSLHTRHWVSKASLPCTLLMLGASGTLFLHLLRFVSYHHTDTALNYIWLNVSVGSWIEFMSLGLACLAISLETLRSKGYV